MSKGFHFKDQTFVPLAFEEVGEAGHSPSENPREDFSWWHYLTIQGLPIVLRSCEDLLAANVMKTNVSDLF